MIVALEIGRKNSKGFPQKNIHQLDKNYEPLMAYPLIAAKNCKYVDEVFYSTDSKIQKEIAKQYGAKILNRPKELATDEALADEVFVSGYNEIRSMRASTLPDIDLIVLLFANSPCITYKMINQMIEILRENKEADSICTVSKYNMFSPYRMRTISDRGKQLHNFLADTWNKKVYEETTCDRDSSGDYYIYDCSAAVVRPRCLENIEDGMPPQKWLGNKIIPYTKYREIPALDIDFYHQIFQIKMWLEKYYYGK